VRRFPLWGMKITKNLLDFQWSFSLVGTLKSLGAP
jgi:hypothetical protein